MCATVPTDRDGKAAKRAGKSEDLPEWMRISAANRARKNSEDRKGTSPDRFISVRGFFFASVGRTIILLIGENVMKTGVIIYVVGDHGEEAGFDPAKAVKNLSITADRVEVISRESGHFDVMDAWWALTARGMSRIICMLGEFVGHSEIRLTGRELRLCG